MEREPIQDVAPPASVNLLRQAVGSSGDAIMAGPFTNLSEAELRALAPQGRTRSFAKRCVVVHEGDRTDTLYVVLSGRVKVFISDENGKEVIIGVVNSGDCFGEMALDGGPRSASVMTLQPSKFFLMPRMDVDRLLEQRPAFARALIDRLIARVRITTETVRALALKNVYARLVRFLEANAVEHDGKRVIRERLTQQDIAARIGCAREMVNRVLRELTTDGYITVQARHIILNKALPWPPPSCSVKSPNPERRST